jgi:lipopolysaccharide biosynthesis protein
MEKQPLSYRVLSGSLAQHPSGQRRSEDPSKLIAFYLPQFHRIPENSSWWGPGFTEWTNVAQAKPNFEGHHQPHVPRELGFYDLSSVSVMREQVELARVAGVHAFCFYHYWFSGRRILETPVNNFLASDIDLPFCVCWANENWTRTWQGDEKSVLLEQRYESSDNEKLIESLLPAFRDPRYIRVDGKPLFLVYRIKQVPNPADAIRAWRAAAQRAGLPGLHVAVVDFYDVESPVEFGADALVEFPPHKFNYGENVPSRPPKIANPRFKGSLIDYRKVIAQSAARESPPYTLYRGIMPGWDNTARRQDTPLIVINNEPSLFGAWLRYLRAWTRLSRPNCSDPFVFINAWNEWGEGCHLEPDVRDGLSYIEETARSSWVGAIAPASSLAQAREQLEQDLRAEATDGSALEAISIARYRGRTKLAHKISGWLRPFWFIHRPARSLYRFVRAVGG